MISKVVTDYLRELARRVQDHSEHMTLDEEDYVQLMDLADTLDEERDSNLTKILASYASRGG